VPAAILGILLAGATADAAEITGDHRLIGRFIEDGAIVEKGWLDATGRYERFGEGRDLTGALTAAFRYGRDVEAGLVIGVLDRSRDAGETLFGTPLATAVDGAGLSDAQIYGKYRILRSPVELAVGLITVVPLADESRGLGAGSFQYRAFFGLRRGFSGATVVWSLGVEEPGDSRAAGRSPGRIGGSVASGVLVPLSYAWTFLGEVNYEARRYSGDGNDLQVGAGIDWRPAQNLALRCSLAAGLSEASPDLTGTLSAAFHF
jgi:hypothetical protein